MFAAACMTYFYQGPNWAVGAFGTVLFFNFVIQVGAYFGLPRALARRFSDKERQTATIETMPDGFRADSGRSASFIPWDQSEVRVAVQRLYLSGPAVSVFPLVVRCCPNSRIDCGSET
jgi:hypothetical protein